MTDPFSCALTDSHNYGMGSFFNWMCDSLNTCHCGLVHIISYPSRAYSGYIRHETLPPDITSGNVLWRKGRKGEVGGCTQRVQTAWPHLGLADIWRDNSLLFGINEVRNKQSHLVGPPFPVFKASSSATAGWHFSRDLTRCFLIGGCGHSHVCCSFISANKTFTNLKLLYNAGYWTSFSTTLYNLIPGLRVAGRFENKVFLFEL